MANDERARGSGNDPQREDMPNGRDISEVRRQGLPGKGFDPGGGYGGAGNDSAYSGESSYGGQSGDGGNSLRGAYAGRAYGRSDDDQRTSGDAPPRDRDEGGRDDRNDRGNEGTRGAPRGAEVPRGTDEESPPNELDVDGAFGADTPVGGERRDELY